MDLRTEAWVAPGRNEAERQLTLDMGMSFTPEDWSDVMGWSELSVLLRFWTALYLDLRTRGFTLSQLKKAMRATEASNKEHLNAQGV